MESKLNEPSTKEIVRALRCDGCDGACSECFFGFEEKDSIGYDTWGCRCGELDNAAADRLESQERDLETFKAFHERYAEQTSKKYVTDICALTARAEQAERERDAAIKDITRLCTRCKHWTCPNDDEPCLSCLNAESGNPNWTWRGQPQEGDKDE